MRTLYYVYCMSTPNEEKITPLHKQHGNSVKNRKKSDSAKFSYDSWINDTRRLCENHDIRTSFPFLLVFVFYLFADVINIKIGLSVSNYYGRLQS